MIRRALLSVSDKTGLFELASRLAKRDIALLSTGGTLAALRASGIPAQAVDEFTGSPEVMDGRVKTLHPRIHGGLLAREGVDDADLRRLGGEPIDLVVVNLYPFEQTLASGNASFEELIEKIDIGGPSMLRSAAKNHHRVTVLCDPTDYEPVLAELEAQGSVSAKTRQALAAKVFAQTARYDAAISQWLNGIGESDGYSRQLSFVLEKSYGLRYGENPHQHGAFYRELNAPTGSLARAESVGSGKKELSFNNLVDADAALEAVREFSEPAAVVIKHASPCGAASAPTLVDAYRLARDADAMSAFGGIVALNHPVDTATAELLLETFLECVVAPDFSDEALAKLHRKPALRLLKLGPLPPPGQRGLHAKRVSFGFVLQQGDHTGPGEVRNGRVVTRRSPTDSELEALEFSWLVCKHVKSNAIVLAAPGGVPGSSVTVGIGGGQTARVLAVEQAAARARDKAKGAVLASDAFFPFPDGIEVAAQAGVKAIAQPGGSKKDDEVIAKADELGLAMIFTGVRHFRH
jgi:phosphoribosylaminoimidazolecarboxamide formyltransferase/IMP cyclohydrolase